MLMRVRRQEFCWDSLQLLKNCEKWTKQKLGGNHNESWGFFIRILEIVFSKKNVVAHHDRPALLGTAMTTAKTNTLIAVS
jgi:hypothetical protein